MNSHLVVETLKLIGVNQNWHNIFRTTKNNFMNSKDEKNTTDPQRNVPAEEGRNSNHNYHDRSAIQPGVSTISTSDYADDNQKITKTAADDFREKVDDDPNADRSFDEVNGE